MHDEPMPVPADLTRIDLRVSSQVSYWLADLGCTEDELRDLVSVAGVGVKEVRELLAWRRRNRQP